MSRAAPLVVAPGTEALVSAYQRAAPLVLSAGNAFTGRQWEMRPLKRVHSGPSERNALERAVPLVLVLRISADLPTSVLFR